MVQWGRIWLYQYLPKKVVHSDTSPLYQFWISMYNIKQICNGTGIELICGMGMKKRGKKLIACILVAAACTTVLFGCGGEESSSAAGAEVSEEKAAGGAGQSGKAGEYDVPEFKDATFTEEKADGNKEVQVDLSSVNDGYFSLVCDSDARIKVQVVKGEDEYIYDVEQKKEQVFPLQYGDGKYTIHVLKNVGGSKYASLYKCEANVKLKSEFEPFLRPNQYADYDKDSECVQAAAKLAASASDENDFISKVYQYICKKITYDYEKAENIKPGYLPDPDETLSEEKGICFDYACLAASMLRSQGVPTKIIFGYVAPDDIYHAWNMYYSKEAGWVAVEFEVNKDEWNRIDLTFSANGADGEFIGDGENYLDAYEF